MKPNSQTLPIKLVLVAAMTLQLSAAFAQDNVLTYQGRVQSSSTNFSGAGLFKFAIVTVSNAAVTATAQAIINGGSLTNVIVTNGGSGYTNAPAVTIAGGGGSGATATASISGGRVVSITVGSSGSGYTSPPTVTIAAPLPNFSYTTHWSNDGTSIAGGEPSAAVPLQVSKGLFTVRLGDSELSNMTDFPVGLFQAPNLELRTWFNDGVHGFGVMDPARRLTAVPYAFTANYASAADGITGTVGVGQISGLIGPSLLDTDAVTSQKIADGTIVLADFSPGVLNNLFWRLSGNSGTTGGQDFVGTTDDTPLDLRVNNLRGLRLQPGGSNSVHVIGGWSGNNVAADVVGATIAGGGAAGSTNRVAADFGTVSGGGGNYVKINSGGGTIGGGQYNSVESATNATIGGGFSNEIGAGSYGATIDGGSFNSISSNAPYAVIPGGYGNFVGPAAEYAFAAGRLARANHVGAFVWGDATDAGVYSTTNNSVTMRASNGYRLFSSSDTSGSAPGVFLSPWANAWSTISDRNAKKNIQPLDPRAVLAKLAQVPVSQWNYKSESDAATPHIGPMAQDFKAAFYPGRDDKGITTLEFDGVALAAIQGLNQKLTEELKRRDSENAELRAAVAELRRRMDETDRKPGSGER